MVAGSIKVAAVFAFIAGGNAYAECPSSAAAGLYTPEAEMPFEIGDTTGLAVVGHLFRSQTSLGEVPCPDWTRGDLAVVVAHPSRVVPFDVTPGDVVRNHFNDWREMSRETITVGGGVGTERIGEATSPSGVHILFYDLSTQYRDGAIVHIWARAPTERREELVARMRTIARSVVRRNNAPNEEEATAAFNDVFVRLREPVIESAVHACLGGEATLDAAMARATAQEWPEFETMTMRDREWRVSGAPPNDAIPIVLMLAQGDSSLTCVIAGAPPIAGAFRNQFETRFSGTGERREFSLVDGAARVGPITTDASYLGHAELGQTERGVTITITLTPTSGPQ